MTAVMKFFGLRAAEFKPLWSALSEADKDQLKSGVTDGSYTYA